MQGLAAARLDKFDILGFDACLMAAFEAVAKFSKYCDYFLASEELEVRLCTLGFGVGFGSLESKANAEARLDLEASVGWVSPSSRGMWGGDALLCSTGCWKPNLFFPDLNAERVVGTVYSRATGGTMELSTSFNPRPTPRHWRWRRRLQTRSCNR
jgi:hypothetical protein